MPGGGDAKYRGRWTTQEDELLARLVGEHGNKNWRYIATHLPGRLAKQCRERWFNQLDPSVRRESLTEEEWRVLVQAHHHYGNHWAEIVKSGLIPGRTANQLKNHWNTRIRRRMTDVGRRRYRGAASRHSAATASVQASRSRKDSDSAEEDDEDDLDDASDSGDSHQGPDPSIFPSRGKQQTISASTSAEIRAAAASSSSPISTLFRGAFPPGMQSQAGQFHGSVATHRGLNHTSGPVGTIGHDASALQGLRALGNLASSAPQLPSLGTMPFMTNPDTAFGFGGMNSNPAGGPFGAVDPSSQFAASQIQLQQYQQQQMMQIQHQYQQQQLQQLLQSGMSLQDIQQLQLRHFLQQQQQQQQMYNNLSILLPPSNYMYSNPGPTSAPASINGNPSPANSATSTSTSASPSTTPPVNLGSESTPSVPSHSSLEAALEANGDSHTAPNASNQTAPAPQPSSPSTALPAEPQQTSPLKSIALTAPSSDATHAAMEVDQPQSSSAGNNHPFTLESLANESEKRVE